MDPDFDAALTTCLRRVPRGRVATCGVVAKALGDVRAARAVAEWLAVRPRVEGAHRVVRADGKPVVPSAITKLRKEGVRISRDLVREDAFLDRLPAVPLLGALREEQRRLSMKVRGDDDFPSLDRIAGVDVAYSGDRMYAAAVCLRTRDLTPLEVVHVELRASFPYIPTYLAYREFPGIAAAVSRLSTRPDVLLIDGHGRLHPARFGVACHVGVRLDVPAIGVAKHSLVGKPIREPASSDAIPIGLEGRTEGYAWVPPGRARAIYVSVGHRISLERALSVVQRATVQGYPEPLRLADRMSKERKQMEKRKKGAKR